MGGRLIDANAYAAEMKTRQDALKELMDDADALDNWEMYCGLSRAFSVFVEAKLTLDNMPTVDTVPVVRCRDCKWFDGKECCDKNGLFVGFNYETFFCADGERRTDE